MKQINIDTNARVRRRHDPMIVPMLQPNQDESQKHPLSSQRSKKRHGLCLVRLSYLVIAISTTSIVLLIGQTLGIRIIPRRTQNTRRPPLPDIPKPPTQRDISVVIMNHDRPYVLLQSSLLPTLLEHPSVSEVLMLHSNPETRFDSGNLKQNNAQKIVDVDAAVMNEEIGLALRFHYCAKQAKNEWVLIMDDDIEIDGTAIDALVHHMWQNPKRVVGHFGRALKRRYLLGTSLAYDTKTVYGNVEVVLTKILLLERELCVKFQETMHLMKDFAFKSKPLWNGEDIFVNLVANRHYKVPPGGPFGNLALEDLPVWEADVIAPKSDGVKSISGNLDDSRLWNVGFSRWWAAYRKSQDHNKYRGDFWLAAKDRLWRYETESS